VHGAEARRLAARAGLRRVAELIRHTAICSSCVRLRLTAAAAAWP
jgi:hypothetical protein